MEPTKKRRVVDNPVTKSVELDDMPLHLIHNIMHFLPYKDAAKFSVLSKSFNSYWLSFPTLNFRFESTPSQDVPFEYLKFINNVLNTLQLRGPYIKGCLHSLSLSHIGRIGQCISNPYRLVFDALLYFAIENKVKIIDLQNMDFEVFHPFHQNHLNFVYFHPFHQQQHENDIINVACDSLLPLFSSQYLTILKLTGIIVPPVDVFINCPKLEELLIYKCHGFQVINVSSSSSLKKVEVTCCKNLKGIQILDGKNLQSFMFEGHNALQQCTFNISDCRTQIRVLKLIKATTITDEWLNRTIRGSSYLEELEISNCNMLRKMEFENYSLKKLSLINCLHLKEVIADVPNLFEFNYSGSLWVCRMIILSSKCNGNISLPYHIPNYLLLKYFIRFFSHFKQLTLSCFNYENMIIPMLMHRLSPALYDLMHLKLEANLGKSLPSGKTLTKLLESLFWLVPKPRSITFSSKITNKTSTLKFKYGKKVESKIVKVGECCNDVPIKCWRHYEREIEFEGFDESVREHLENFFNVI